MAKIVVIPDDVISKQLTAVEFARRLRSAGHSVTLIGAAESVPEGEEFDYTRCDLRLRPVPDAAPMNSWDRFRSRRRRIEACVAASNSAAFETLLQELSPDLLLVDIECHEYIIATRRLGYPVGLINVFFNLWRGHGCPPLSSALSPDRGALAAQLAWTRLAASKYYRRWREYLLTGGLDRYSLLAGYAQEQDFALAQTDRRQWLIPFLYRGLPVITANLLELDFPHRPHPDSRYVGPLIRRPGGGVDRSDKPAQSQDEAEVVARILAEREGASPRPRLIYAGSGALDGTGAIQFWNKIGRAFAAEQDWIVILGLGAVIRPEELDPLPPNVHALSWAPQTTLLQHADCALIHGGMTTVYECIHAGVPMVVCPFRVNDQLGTAARVDYHGLGILVDRTAEAETIAHGARRVLTDPAFRERIEPFRLRLQRHRDDDSPARAVDDLLAWGRPGLPTGWAQDRAAGEEAR